MVESIVETPAVLEDAAASNSPGIYHGVMGESVLIQLEEWKGLGKLAETDSDKD